MFGTGTGDMGLCWSPALVLELAVQLAEGMVFLHSHSIVHRDLKPQVGSIPFEHNDAPSVPPTNPASKRMGKNSFKFIRTSNANALTALHCTALHCTPKH